MGRAQAGTKKPRRYLWGGRKARLDPASAGLYGAPPAKRNLTLARRKLNADSRLHRRVTARDSVSQLGLEALHGGHADAVRLGDLVQASATGAQGGGDGGGLVGVDGRPA